MPNVMVALPNIGGALYSTPQSLAGAHYYMPCSNAAKTRNQLKFGGVPQTNETISAASMSKFTILWQHPENIFHKRQHRGRTQMVQSYLPGSANVHPI